MRTKRPLFTLLLLSILFSCQPDVHPVNPGGQDDISRDADATIFGKVSCGGEGIPGVVVSDGFEVVVTDGEGVYNIKSDKALKYVFMSLPRGYEALSDGVLPRFSARLTKNGDVPERVDFLLNEVDQSNYSMLLFGDMHLASRSFCHDLQQFREFADDVNGYMSTHKGRYYALTLGDMSWDSFWISNHYDLNNYLAEVNEDFPTLQMFHTMGNHDNDRSIAGDFDAASTYRRIIGPSYYSFNIGEIHYVVLDDIEYTNEDLDGSYRSYLAKEQISWLKKDLAYVSKKTPVVVAMHAPLYRRDGSSALPNLWEFISNFEGFDRVQVFTAHTHVLYNVDMLQRSIHIYENNSGTVCGSLWMSASNCPGVHICCDGSPGGYRVMDVKGKEMTSFYKATGWPESHQFRVYDRNSICLDSQQWLPNASMEDKKSFEKTAGEYATASKENKMLINLWDYDPSWTVTVTENGKNLPVTKLENARDPLYLVAYEAYEYEHGYRISYPSSTTDHIFQVTASTSSSNVEITVRDRFGRTFSETVTRPKRFSPEEYSVKK